MDFHIYIIYFRILMEIRTITTHSAIVMLPYALEKD